MKNKATFRVLFLIAALNFFTLRLFSQIDVFTGLLDKVKGAAPWIGYSPGNKTSHYGFEFMFGPFQEEDNKGLLDSIEAVRLHYRLDTILIKGGCKKGEWSTDTCYLGALKRAKTLLKKENPWEADFGIGTDFFNGYHGRSDTFSLRANVRGFYFSSYLYTPTWWWNKKRTVGLDPYFGGLIGFYQLQNSTVNQNNTAMQFDMSGNTVSAELVGGFSFDFGNRASVYFEMNGKYLLMQGIQYKPVNSGSVPNYFPNHLDLNGIYFSIGTQFNFNKN